MAAGHKGPVHETPPPHQRKQSVPLEFAEARSLEKSALPSDNRRKEARIRRGAERNKLGDGGRTGPEHPGKRNLFRRHRAMTSTADARDPNGTTNAGQATRAR